MMVPPASNAAAIRRVGSSRGPWANRSGQRKVRANSALSKTAGITVENEMLERRTYSSPVNTSPPKYCQLRVRQLMTSKSHQAGAEATKVRTKAGGERVRIEVPL